MANVDPTGFSEFDRLVELVRTTRELLDRMLLEGRIEPDGADYLADATLPHLEGARRGLRAWLRTEMAGLRELQYLVRQDGLVMDGPRGAAERRAALAEARLEARLRRSQRPSFRLSDDERYALTALAHARLVLGALPRLPDDEVRFRGGRQTYADIPAPRGPAELAGRLEELEREVWHIAVGQEVGSLDPAFRRTYGFFDVADRLASRGFRLH